jgi:hypothetical protein
MVQDAQPLTEARKGEIAQRILKYILRKKNFDLAPEIGQIAKELDIPLAELLQFIKPIAQEDLSDIMEEDRVIERPTFRDKDGKLFSPFT